MKQENDMLESTQSHAKGVLHEPESVVTQGSSSRWARSNATATAM